MPSELHVLAKIVSANHNENAPYGVSPKELLSHIIYVSDSNVAIWHIWALHSSALRLTSISCIALYAQTLNLHYIRKTVEIKSANKSYSLHNLMGF